MRRLRIIRLLYITFSFWFVQNSGIQEGENLDQETTTYIESADFLNFSGKSLCDVCFDNFCPLRKWLKRDKLLPRVLLTASEPVPEQFLTFLC